jgi:hypothetical protein
MQGTSDDTNFPYPLYITIRLYNNLLMNKFQAPERKVNVNKD